MQTLSPKVIRLPIHNPRIDDDTELSDYEIEQLSYLDAYNVMAGDVV